MRRLGCFAFLLLTAFVCAQNFDGYLNINYGFQPEGIEYINHDGNVGFLLSSLNSDAIYICSDDGNCEIFSRGGDQLTSTVGLQIDYDNELLYVCNVDTFANLTDVGSVVALNLKDGSVAWNADVTKLGTKGAPKLVNDVSLPDSDGNVYATESLQGLIFKISSSGKASLFVNNGTLISPQDALLFGANGIDIVSYDGEEYLLVGVSGLTPETSYLVRVPISNPKKMSIVDITNGDSIYSLDGLYYDRTAQNLYAVSNAANLIHKLASSDGWQTATIIASITPKCPGSPASTVVHLDNNPNHVGSAYVLCPDAFSQRGPYQIENIEFYDVSGSYFYYYYFYSVTNSASSLSFFFALAACVIALAL